MTKSDLEICDLLLEIFSAMSIAGCTRDQIYLTLVSFLDDERERQLQALKQLQNKM